MGGVASAEDAVRLLAPVASLEATPGQELVLDINPLDAENPPRLMMDRGPVAASLHAEERGWTLRWVVPERISPSSTIVLLAIDRQDPTRRERVELQIPLASAADPDPSAQPVLTDTQTPVTSEVSPDVQGDPSVLPLTLPALPEQRLTVGRTFSLWLRAKGGVQGVGVDMRAEDAPDGISVTEQDQGWHRLDWVPSLEQVGPHTVEILAVSQQDRLREVRQKLKFVVAPADASERVEDAAASEVAAPKEPVVQRADAKQMAIAPTLDVMSNYIVSAGRTVQFRVTPRIEPDQPSVVQVDRLPRNASFDENPDGSRTFHWLTSDRDQGEHRFRFTAMNAVDSSLRDTREVTVIVGDPTRGKTVPSQ